MVKRYIKTADNESKKMDKIKARLNHRFERLATIRDPIEHENYYIQTMNIYHKAFPEKFLNRCIKCGEIISHWRDMRYKTYIDKCEDCYSREQVVEQTTSEKELVNKKISLIKYLKRTPTFKNYLFDINAINMIFSYI
jgi:hypothetical protein